MILRHYAWLAMQDAIIVKMAQLVTVYHGYKIYYLKYFSK